MSDGNVMPVLVDAEPALPRLVGDSPTEQPRPPLLVAAAAGSMFGVSARVWRKWDVFGLIPAPIELGRNKWWRPAELVAWAEAGCPKRRVWRWSPPS